MYREKIREKSQFGGNSVNQYCSVSQRKTESVRLHILSAFIWHSIHSPATWFSSHNLFIQAIWQAFFCLLEKCDIHHFDRYSKLHYSLWRAFSGRIFIKFLFIELHTLALIVRVTQHKYISWLFSKLYNLIWHTFSDPNVLLQCISGSITSYAN